MNYRIFPSSAAGRVKAPPSKSNAHRLLICAGLSAGESHIKGIEECEDVLATIDCLKAMGAEISNCGADYTVRGISPYKVKSGTEFLCRESGSTLRFFIPIALLSGKNTVLSGTAKLLSRPLGIYSSICEEKGLYFSRDASSVAVKGPLQSGEFKLCGNVSSQFISGLLFALPLAANDSTICITPPIESLSYINLTIAALKKFGVEAVWQDENTIFIKGNQEYLPIDAEVEGDYSNAAFYDALNFLGGSLEIDGLSPDSLQGDKVYHKLFESISKGMPAIHISDCPDLGPILFALAAAKNGAVFTGTKRLKIKESDRAEAMASELRKFGVSVTVHDDAVVVFPKEFHAPSSPLEGHNDHRIVMALSCLLTITGGIIEGAEAVNKSNPNFFENLKESGIGMEEI